MASRLAAGRRVFGLRAPSPVATVAVPALARTLGSSSTTPARIRPFPSDRPRPRRGMSRRGHRKPRQGSPRQHTRRQDQATGPGDPTHERLLQSARPSFAHSRPGCTVLAKAHCPPDSAGCSDPGGGTRLSDMAPARLARPRQPSQWRVTEPLAQTESLPRLSDRSCPPRTDILPSLLEGGPRGGAQGGRARCARQNEG